MIRHSDVILASTMFIVCTASHQSLANDCGQILQYGVWENHTGATSDAESSAFANWACSASSRSGGGGISYGGIGANFSDSDSSSACSGSTGNYSLSQSAKDDLKTASKTIVEAWTTCINSYGSYATVVYKDDSAHFDILLQTRTQNNGHGKAILTSVDKDLFNCNVPYIQLSKGIEYDNAKTVSCVRSNPADSISISVDYPDKWPGQGLYIPGVTKSATAPDRARIVSVVVPKGSSDGPSWSLDDQVWSADFPSAPGAPMGIGHIIDPIPTATPWSKFAMHSHGAGAVIAPNVPNPALAVVTYTFDKPTQVSGIKVVQHQNGFLKITGSVGDSPDHLITMGDAYSFTLEGGSVCCTFPEAGRDIFLFKKPGTGKIFQFTIDKTVERHGYAFYRAVPFSDGLVLYDSK